MYSIMSSRGPFIICSACYAFLKEENQIDDRNRAASDAVAEEFCMNCFDRNKVLIDDLAGSSE